VAEKNPDVRLDLSTADLKEAGFGWTVLGNIDLSVAKGLETVKHEGPSSVGVDTLVRCQGRIPDEFLRGCGFTPWQILEAKLYDPALTAHEISELQYKIFDLRAHGPLYIGGVFISYSHADSNFVDKIYQRLQKAGVSAWLDRTASNRSSRRDQLIELLHGKAGLVKSAGIANVTLDGRGLVAGDVNVGLGQQVDDLVAGQILGTRLLGHEKHLPTIAEYRTRWKARTARRMGLAARLAGANDGTDCSAGLWRALRHV